MGVAGAVGDDGSYDPSLSADARIVAFVSYASNLVVDDTNDATDVFVRDRLTGITTLVSKSSGGTQGNASSGSYCVTSVYNAPSYGLAISADGRFVVFSSAASNLVVGDTNGSWDVFVHDRQTGSTERVSVGPGGVEGNNDSPCSAISSDGRYVAFTSSASNLVTGDTNGAEDVFVRDRQTGVTERVSLGPAGVQANSGSYHSTPAISADGRIVAFESEATNLVNDDTNGVQDVFIHDRDAETTTRVSMGVGGSEGNGHSHDPVLSADGRFIAFESEASNLVAGDTNGARDVFIYDSTLHTTARVSAGLGGAQADGPSYLPAISADGRVVAFESQATNLVLGDTNLGLDVFVRELVTSATTRVSVGTMQGHTFSSGSEPALSADGRFVAFNSGAALVEDDTIGMDVFLRDRLGMVRPFPPAGDYDGDSRDDVVVYRPPSAVWYLLRSGAGSAGLQWGLPLDVPVPADYDGDGRTDVAVYRPETGVWYIVRSSTGTAIGVRWGLPGDVPAPADFDGDGRCDPAVFRPSTGVWYELRSGTGGFGVRWGAAGDVPVPADYDGDGRADPTVFRPSTGRWYQLRSTTGAGYGVVWGAAGDTPLAGDYDGDGKADPTIYRPSTGTWYQLRSLTATGYGVAWGVADDEPVVGDYDADGKADPTVFRASTGTWYQLRSLTGTGFGVRWGMVGDIPR